MRKINNSVLDYICHFHEPIIPLAERYAALRQELKEVQKWESKNLALIYKHRDGPDDIPAVVANGNHKGRISRDLVRVYIAINKMCESIGVPYQFYNQPKGKKPFLNFQDFYPGEEE